MNRSLPARTIRRHAARWAMTAVVLALAVPRPAAAQATFGPLEIRPPNQAGWLVTPSFSVSEGYDNNVVLAGQRSPTTDDYLSTIGPGLDLSFTGRRTTFDAAYQGSFLRYRSLNQLDSFDQHAHAEFRRDLTKRLSVALRNDYSVLPTTDRVELDNIPFLRIGSRVESLRGGVVAALGKYTSAEAGYAFESVAFARDSQYAPLLEGGYAHTAYGNVKRKVDERLAVGAEGEFRRVTVAGGLEQFDIVNAEGTVEYRLAPRMTLSGGLGFARLAGIPGSAPRNGPAWRVVFSHRAAYTLVTVSYTGSIVPSYGIGGTTQNQALSASVRVPLRGDRLYWLGGVAWQKNDPLTNDPYALRTVWADTALGYAFDRWLRVEAFFSRSHQNSQRPGGVVDRTSAGLRLATEMPMRFR